MLSDTASSFCIYFVCIMSHAFSLFLARHGTQPALNQSMNKTKLQHGETVRLVSPCGIELSGQVVQGVGRWDAGLRVYIRSWQVELSMDQLQQEGWKVINSI